MKNKNIFKNTEIGKIPKEWEVTTLDGVTDINKESIDTLRELPNKELLYIDIDSVENGTGVIKEVKEIIGKDAPSRARRVMHYNDVIMSTVRPYLKAFALVPRKYDKQICSTGFAVLTCKEKMLPHYLLYTIFSKLVIDQCNRMMVGAQYPALNSSQVGKIKIPLPPLPEQKKIAEILSSVDEAIQKVEEAIAKAERLKKGLMNELLIKGIGHREFKNTKIGRIPKEWEAVAIKDISNVKRGASPRPIGDPSYFADKGRGWIRIADVTNTYKYLKKTSQYLSKKGEDRSVKVNHGDLIMSICATIGKPIILDMEACIHDGFVWFSELSKDVNVEYLFYVLQKNENTFSSKRQTGTQGNINTTLVGRTCIPLPPLHEQQKIAGVLSTVDEKIELLRKRKERFTRLKNGLMNELLTGNKRVKI